MEEERNLQGEEIPAEPETVTEEPAADAAEPEAGTEEPEAEAVKPEAEAEKIETEAAEPEAPAEEPATETAEPEETKPEDESKKSKSWKDYLVPMLAYLVPVLAALVILCLFILPRRSSVAEAPAENAAAQTETETEAETEAEADQDELSQEEMEAQVQAILDAMERAYAAHDPKEVVGTIDGRDVTWDMYYYLLTDELMTVVYYTGGIPEDFDAALTEEMTVGKYLQEAVLEKVNYFVTINNKAEELGTSLTEEQEQEIQEYMDHLVEQYGGEEALAEALDDSYLNPELLRDIVSCNEEKVSLMEELYGAAGEKMTEEEVAEWATQEGYIRVKHILYYFYNDDGTEMDEAGKAEMRAKAEAALAELQAIEDNEALAQRFHELMNTDSGDAGGLIQFQNGYTFTSGTMYPEFEEAAFALEEYALSDIVESSSGYHVILRLPLDPEGTTLNQSSGTGAYMTLRETAANEQFNRKLSEWIKEAQVTWSEEFENMDMNALFHEG